MTLTPDVYIPFHTCGLKYMPKRELFLVTRRRQSRASSKVTVGGSRCFFFTLIQIAIDETHHQAPTHRPLTAPPATLPHYLTNSMPSGPCPTPEGYLHPMERRLPPSPPRPTLALRSSWNGGFPASAPRPTPTAHGHRVP